MLQFCKRYLVRMGTVKPCGSVKSYNLVRPVPAIFAADRNLTQKTVLPKMPVPPLKQTFECYLSMLESIVTADELKHTTGLVEEFLKPGGIGERLQRGLERRAYTTENWSTDDYLKSFRLVDRTPLVIHSNYGILFNKKDITDKKGQIRCAAELIASVLDIKTMIDNDRLPVDFMGGKPLCMKQYEQVMSSCRIPSMKTDLLVFHTKSSQPSKHITVVHNFQFYELDVYNSDGTLLTVEQLCVQLERICCPSVQTNVEPVGILTTQQRDIWCKTYKRLLQDETNKESLSAIQSSIFTVCLDDAMPPVSEEIMYRKRGIIQMLHGGGSNWNSGNRWFDKGLQIIIGQDGTWGINSSHATADGIVLMDICDRAVAKMKNLKMMQSPVKHLPMPKKLHFNVTPEIRKDIEEAKQNIDLMVQKLNLRVMVFAHFGKNLIKAYRLSPDAFVQMALQLAYYRIFKQCCAVMEPVSLRLFTLGRVAPVHSNSKTSAAFIKAFDDPQKKNLDKVDLLDKAIKEHRRKTKMAINGHTIGVHLTGLMLQAVEENISSLGVFTDVSYVKALHFKLSTSQVTSKMGSLPCIGPEEPGTYDVAYSIMDNHIDCTVSCFEGTETYNKINSEHMIQAIEGALLDMRTLLEQTQSVKY